MMSPLLLPIQRGQVVMTLLGATSLELLKGGSIIGCSNTYISVKVIPVKRHYNSLQEERGIDYQNYSNNLAYLNRMNPAGLW